MIKRALLGHKCRILAKAWPKEHLSYSNSSHIGILCNSVEFDRTFIEGLFDDIKKDGKDLVLLSYTDKEAEGPFTFNKKDISFFGALHKDEVTFFINQKFDFLIALDHSGDINFKYVLALSHATCKIGLNADAYGHLAQLIIKLSGCSSEGMREIMKYIKMI